MATVMQEQAAGGRPFAGLAGFTWRVAAAHTLTYFVFGLVMSRLLDYGGLFQQEVIRDFMRPADSAWVFAGPFVQPVRGVLLALGLWPFRATFVRSRWGWLSLWGILLTIGILATPAAAPCSVEGVIYSKLPLSFHLIGLPEIMLQTLAFSWLVAAWERKRLEAREVSRDRAAGGVVAGLVKAVVTACFAWVGYAVGGLSSAALVGVKVNLGSAAHDIRTQMMFVVAFVVNVAVVYVVGKEWTRGRVPLWLVFALFWAVDTAVPMLYQLAFSRPSWLPLALLLGLFPAVAITLTMRLSFPRVMEAERAGTPASP